jgi:hypothetical protein
VKRDDAAGQGQPEPGALLLAGLLELLEDPVLIGGIDANARVGHRHLRPFAHPASAHLHPPPVRGELDRIGEQVEDHLLHLALVGFHFVQIGICVDATLDAVTCGSLPHHRDAILEYRGQDEGGQLELHLAGLDLRQVEGVVDE